MKHGWVLQEKFLFKGDCRFCCCGGGYVYELGRAWVLDNRRVMRFMKLDHETIRKVSLTEEGIPIKIIGRG